jgi:predicted DNA-binding transcriptional regulator AlpA
MRDDKQTQLTSPVPVTRRRRPSLTSADQEILEPPLLERLRGIDRVLSTRDIEQITDRHRCTIYRWVRAGTFPSKRAGGGRGWLRSDVERWLVGDGSSESR